MAARLVQAPTAVVCDIPPRRETPPWVRIAVTQFLLSDSTKHKWRGPEMYKMVCDELRRLFPDVDITEHNDFRDYNTFYTAVWKKHGGHDATYRTKNKPRLYDRTRVHARAWPTCVQTCVGCV